MSASLPFSGGSEPSEGSTSFFERLKTPEGIFTLLLIIGAVVLGLKFMDVIVPWLIQLAENTIYLIGLCLVIAFFAYLCVSKEAHLIMWRLYQRVIRGVWGLIISSDPIGMMKDHIADMHKEKAKFDQQRDNLGAVKERLDRDVKTNEAAMANDLRVGKKAAELGDRKNAGLASLRAGEYKSTNDKLIPLRNAIEKLYLFLDRASDAADTTIQQMEFKVGMMQKEYESITAGRNALASAMRIFKGDDEKQAIFNQSVDFLERDMSKKVAEMRRIVKFSEGIITQSELQQGAALDEGMELLDRYIAGEDVSFIQESSAKKANSIGSDLLGYIPSDSAARVAMTQAGLPTNTAKATLDTKWD